MNQTPEEKLLKLPYGKGFLDCWLPADRITEVLEVSGLNPNEMASYCDEEEIVRRSLLNPISSPRLKELAIGKKNIVIIASDHTRPVPSKIIMPQILAEIREGNPRAEITILIATGCHRSTTAQELRYKFGEEIFLNEKIIIHDCDSVENIELQEKLPSGGRLIINRLVEEADLLVAEGFIEPHFFAGFSGGRKSVLPGVAGRETVLANHCAEFIAHPKARAGILEGNPIHEDMIFAAERLKLDFIVNVIIDPAKKIVKAYSGHFNLAHLEGAAFLTTHVGIKSVRADIVITTNGGYPLDQNIYQAVKGMTTAEACCNVGGIIIIAAQCADGHGGSDFFETFKSERNPKKIMDKIMATNRSSTIPDQWQSQIFARILMQHKVIMVTDAPRDMVEALHMQKADNLNIAIEMADAMMGRKEKITVIPDGISVMIT